MPKRSELDPAALRAILSDLMIIDVAEGKQPGRHVFTYRLVGTSVDDNLGIHITGKTVQAALLNDAADSVQQQYEMVVVERRPVLCTHRMMVAETRYVEYQRLALPLAGEDGLTVVALVAAVNFTCAYSVEAGRPSFCRGPNECDCQDLCLDMAIRAAAERA